VLDGSFDHLPIISVVEYYTTHPERLEEVGQNIVLDVGRRHTLLGLRPVTVATVRRHPWHGCRARSAGHYLSLTTARLRHGFQPYGPLGHSRHGRVTGLYVRPLISPEVGQRYSATPSTSLSSKFDHFLPLGAASCGRVAAMPASAGCDGEFDLGLNHDFLTALIDS
jgi:hypothetical protein